MQLWPMATVEIPPRIRPLQRITSTWLNSIIDALEKLRDTLTAGTADIYVRSLVAALVRSGVVEADDAYVKRLLADLVRAGSLLSDDAYAENLLAGYIAGDRGWFRDLFAEYLQAERIKADNGQFASLATDTLQADSVGGRRGVFTDSVQTSFVDSKAGSFSDYLLVAGIPVTPGVAGAGPATYVAASDQVVSSVEIGVIPTGAEHNVRNLTVRGSLHVKGSLQAFGSVDVQGDFVMKGDVSVHTLPPYAPLPSDRNASGVDPHSPPWAPPEGWGQVVEFTSSTDLDFFNYRAGELSVEAHTLKLHYTSPTLTYAELYEENVPFWRRTAACVLPFNRLAEDDYMITYFDAYCEKEGDIYVGGTVYQAGGDGGKLFLYDYATGEITPAEYNGDWIVAVLDFEARTLTVYDRRGQVLGVAQLQAGGGVWTSRWLGFFIRGSAFSCSQFYVDWVAVV